MAQAGITFSDLLAGNWSICKWTKLLFHLNICMEH
jgi:hypothetical protein